MPFFPLPDPTQTRYKWNLKSQYYEANSLWEIYLAYLDTLEELYQFLEDWKSNFLSPMNSYTCDNFQVSFYRAAGILINNINILKSEIQDLPKMKKQDIKKQYNTILFLFLKGREEEEPGNDT